MIQRRCIGIFILLLAIVFCSCHSDLKPKEIDEVIGSVDSLIASPGSDTSFVPVDTSIIRNFDVNLFNSSRFDETNIYSENQIKTEKGQYWKANDYIGRSIDLGYTFVAPANDTMRARPFVLLLHEGAFLFGNRGNEESKVKLLAQKGYAAASIDYRIGFNGGREGFACEGNNMEVYQAIYRSVQDIYVALHYFMDNSAKFGIDPRNVIIGGTSAGGIAASAFLYMVEEDFEKLRPGIVKILGKLDPYPNHTGFQIKALVTNLGYAIIQSSYISTANAKPTLFFQRTGDDILAYEKGKLFFCNNYFYTEGAKNTSNKLEPLGIPYELNYEPMSGHKIGYPENYIMTRYAKFIKRIWGNDRRQIINENYTNIQNKTVR